MSQKKKEESQPIGERVAVLETKLEKPMTEEERYIARKAKYMKNIAARKEKQDKLDALKEELGE